MTIERRLHPRATVGLPAMIQVKERPGWERVILIDISEGGSGIQLAAELPLQSEVRLRFTLPVADDGDVDLEASGLVVRTARGTRDDEEFPVRTGLLFLSFAGEGLETVRRWVWSRLN